MGMHDVFEVNWAVEILGDEDANGDAMAEYYAATALMADGEWLVVTTPDGQEITLRRENVKRILVMRTELPALPPAEDVTDDGTY